MNLTDQMTRLAQRAKAASRELAKLTTAEKNSCRAAGKNGPARLFKERPNVASLAWYLMSHWLNNYAYRVDIGWWVFVASGSASIVIAFLTVSLQGLRAALANPVESLRSE